MNETTAIAVLVLGTLLFTLFAFFLIVYVVLQKRKQFQHKLEKQELEHRFSSELLQSKIEVQEEAFRQFSEEIHDNVGQLLSLSKMQLHKVASKVEDEQLKKSTNNTLELISQAVNDLRTISHTMNGSFVLKSGLSESIHKELHYISSAKDINCNFTSSGDTFPLGEDRELLVFRIIQESLANAIKHGVPENIEVSLEHEEGYLNVEISDDGNGFDMDVHNADAGIGLSNMHTRAQLLNGTLIINSAIKLGTSIKLKIPITYE